MKKLFYIDSCMRPESRTAKIAGALIEELGKKYEIETTALSLRNMPTWPEESPRQTGL